MKTTASPIEALLDQLTLAEQVQLLTGQDFWSTPPIERLGIPSVKVSDGPNGARGGIFKDGPKTACFPCGVAVSSTWNPELVEAMGQALAVETKLKGAQVLLAPTMNLHRTVYNGRNFECHSEDPWLGGEMAVAYVKGVQSGGVAATLKHFLGNESEFQRMTANSVIPERALRELYLVPFERAVKEAAAMCVMTGYNKVNGDFCADNFRLVQQILREEWGFDGLVMSDWFANHHTDLSVRAGCDLEMPGPTRERGAKLLEALQAGRVDVQDVRDCARRVLQLAERLGRFDNPTVCEERADDLPEHRTLIRRMGAEGAVLLKNDHQLLPLNLPAGTKVAVIGRPAVEAQINGGGSANVNAQHRISPLEGLRAARPDLTFIPVMGADIFRYTPVAQQPMVVDYYNTEDLTGPVVVQETSPNTEVMWNDRTPPGLNWGSFSARAHFEFTADAEGLYQFSIISAGRACLRLNGEVVIDRWDQWERGDTYFTFGCNEAVYQRTLCQGDRVQVEVDYTTEGVAKTFYALRVGASRLLGESDVQQAVEAARQADVAIVFAGLNAEWDNEGLDRPGIDLPHRQNELVQCVREINPNTVVVLQSGSPLSLPWLANVKAVLQAWYPGQECGHAIADVLLGLAEPGGRLPQTWPQRIEDTVAYGVDSEYPGLDGEVNYAEGVFIGYRHHEAHGLTPMFPFGHGLSYSRFEISNLRVNQTTIQPSDQMTVTAHVKNVGPRAGSEVVQLYVSDVRSTLSRPLQELKAFGKVHLMPGEQREVTMPLDMRSFAAYDPSRAAWWAEAGEFDIRVGRSSAERAASVRVTLAADWLQPTRA